MTYKLPPEQLANQMRRGVNRRNIEAMQGAQRRRLLARSAANRLERSIAKGGELPDESIVGLYRKLRSVGETRVAGPNWRKPRPGRRW